MSEENSKLLESNIILTGNLNVVKFPEVTDIFVICNIEICKSNCNSKCHPPFKIEPLSDTTTPQQSTGQSSEMRLTTIATIIPKITTPPTTIAIKTTTSRTRVTALATTIKATTLKPTTLKITTLRPTTLKLTTLRPTTLRLTTLKSTIRPTRRPFRTLPTTIRSIGSRTTPYFIIMDPQTTTETSSINTVINTGEHENESQSNHETTTKLESIETTKKPIEVIESENPSIEKEVADLSLTSQPLTGN